MATEPTRKIDDELCDKCNHPNKDHKYQWSGPWDWWECHCGCKLDDTYGESK